MKIPFLGGDDSNADEILEELGQLTGQDDLAKRAESALNAFEGQDGDKKGDDDKDDGSDDKDDSNADSGDDDASSDSDSDDN